MTANINRHTDEVLITETLLRECLCQTKNLEIMIIENGIYKARVQRQQEQMTNAFKMFERRLFIYIASSFVIMSLAVILDHFVR